MPCSTVTRFELPPRKSAAHDCAVKVTAGWMHAVVPKAVRKLMRDTLTSVAPWIHKAVPTPLMLAVVMEKTLPAWEKNQVQEKDEFNLIEVVRLL